VSEVRDQDSPLGFTDPIASLRAALQGRYEIERQIGQGAFATVYLARDLKHERKVAIKVLNADPESETGEIRFIREIRVVARLQHPNILPLHDSGHVEALLYYVMPYVMGETLRIRMQRERQMGVEAACAIARETADALAYAHSQGIVHRDIKPENILLSGGHAIVADFGIARAIDVSGVRQLTMTGVGGPGTPAYMSPEQLLGDRGVDARSDIYSLGCVLHEMLAGKPPFPGKDGFVKRFTEPPPRIASLRRDSPPWIDDAVAKAMSKDPADRFATASDFLAALSHQGAAARAPARVHPALHALASPPLFDSDPLEAEEIGATSSPSARVRTSASSSDAGDLSGSTPGTHPRAWLRQIRRRPRGIAIAALSLVLLMVAFKQNAIGRWVGAFGPQSAIDSARVVLLPLTGTASASDRDRVAEGIYAALSEWRGLNLVSDRDVRGEIRENGPPASTRAAADMARRLGAARFIWGQLTDGESPQGRFELYDAAAITPLKAVNVAGAFDASRLAATARELLEIPGRPQAAEGGDGKTRSYPAWTAYGRGHIALQAGNLQLAENFFRVALAADAGYAPARVWLAQTLAWKNPGVPNDWRDEVLRARGASTALSEKDQVIATALSQLSESRYPDACGSYSLMTASDSADFVGLYGFGHCNAFDSLVVPSPTSPSRWRFRSRYSDAASAYMNALRVNPNAHSFFPFEQLQELLPIASTKTRRGKNAAGENFAAYPALIRDTVVFVPYPLLEFARLSAADAAPAQSTALARNLDNLLDFAREWTRDAPQSSPAHLALSSVLEARGEISRARAGGPSAIQAVRTARQLAGSSRDSTLASTAEAWLLFKQGDFARARVLADSVLRGLRDVSPETATQVIGLAALTGKIGRTADFARLTAYSPGAGAAPLPVMDAAAAFFAFAAAGVCADTTFRLERRLDEQLMIYVAETEQAQLASVLKARPISMLAPCTAAKSSLRVHAPSNKLLGMQQSLASSDTAGLKTALAAVSRHARTQRPGDIALDFAFQIAWLRAASGDTLAAALQLDRVLGSLSTLSAVSVRETGAAAAAPRAMALRAELAAARGEETARRKWARAVVDLLAGADAPLQPVVARMRLLAGPGTPK